MASGRIKGITIEIDGNTTKLQSALKGVDKSLRDTQSALRDVNKLLKMDPKNVTLLEQKQKLLKQAITDTEQKLKTEKEALAQLKQADQTPEVTRQMEALERQIIEDEQKLKSLNKEMKDFGSVGVQQMKALGEQMKQTGDKVKNVGENMSKYITAPIAALGAASIAAFADVDKGYDVMIAKTGATGDAADELRGIMENIGGDVPASFEDIGAAIGEVNTRFGATGEDLEALSEKFLKFSELNRTDVSSSIDSVQKALSAFGLGAEYAGPLLDRLNLTGQQTGVSMDSLTSGLIQNATAFEELGLSVDQSVILMGQMEKSGANSETVMQGLRKALKNAATEGKPLDEALSELQDTILNGTDGMDGLTAAYDLFGKSGDQIYGAVKNGTLDFSDMAVAAEDAGGSIENTFEETEDPLKDFQKVMNDLKVLLADVAGPILELLTPAIEKLKEIIENLKEKWDNLSPTTQKFIIIALAIAAAAGPIIAIIGGIIGALGNIIIIAPAIAASIATMEAPLLPIIGIIAGIIAAVIAIIYIVNHWGEICEWFKGVWENFTAVIKAVWEQVQQYLQAAWEVLKTVALTVWKAIKMSIIGPIQIVWTIIQAVWNAIKTFLQNEWNGIKIIAQTVWNVIKTVIVTPIQTAWRIISTVVQSIRSTVSNVFYAIWGTVQTVWNGIKNAIITPIQTAWSVISGIVQSIKNLFPLHIGKIFSGLKLPHFSITGGQAPFGIAGRGSLPHFHVSWYKKAYDNPYLINTPTIFQTPYGLKGFGDGNGGELVYGRNQLMRDIAAASGGETTINIYASQGMDVNALADAVQSRLVRLQKQREKAYA